MSCRQCQGVEVFFDRKEAGKKLKEYRLNGPARTTSMLVDALKAEGVEGLNLLDIGGRVGAIQYDLLRAGASRVTAVEASTAYLDVVRQEAEWLGYVRRISYHKGDFTDRAPEIAAADVVTLDRVICCYDVTVPPMVGEFRRSWMAHETRRGCVATT